MLELPFARVAVQLRILMAPQTARTSENVAGVGKNPLLKFASFSLTESMNWGSTPPHSPKKNVLKAKEAYRFSSFFNKNKSCMAIFLKSCYRLWQITEVPASYIKPLGEEKGKGQLCIFKKD